MSPANSDAMGGLLRTAAIVAAALCAIAGEAGAQAALNYRSAEPRALVRVWTQLPEQQRAPIVDAMAERRDEVLPALWEAARFGTAQEKLFACGMIAELRDRDGVDVLVDASADADVRVRRRAATALRILADRRAAPRLRAILRTESDLGTVKTALAALGKLGQARDARLVGSFLDHADANVRVVAAGALAMLGDERGLDLVLQATASTDPAVQKNATYALGLFRAPAAGAKLDAILADPQSAWRAYALLGQAERALHGQTPARQVALLDELAQIRSRTVAEWAVDRLTDLGGPDAAAALQRASQRSTPVGKLAARRLAIVEQQP